MARRPDPVADRPGLLITSSLLGSVNFITTIINLRARGMTWMRMPFFVWAMLVTGFLLLLAFPPLEAAGIMQLMDRVAHSSFFLPSGLFTKSEGLADISGGGSPLLYQHLFWFLGHPEVYVLLLPAFACVSEIIPANTRKPLWGYKSMVYSVLVLGFLSFIVWAHHMYMTGMGAAVSTFFQTTTVLISVPSVVIITSMLISLWGGSIRFTPPMLWACAFIPMFGIGGLTGLPLAFNLADLHLHDTYYVIGHFHYVVAPGILFGFFAGVLHWYPKITGRYMSRTLNHLHFWPSLVCMNIIFFPMLLQGMAGFHRRWYNGGDAYLSKAADSANVFGNTVASHIDMNILMSMGAWTHGARADSVHHQPIHLVEDRQERSKATIHGMPPPSNGRRRRLRATAISPSIPPFTVVLTNTAVRTARRISSRSGRHRKNPTPDH